MSAYKYNKDQLRFTEEKPTFWGRLRKVLYITFSIIALIVLYYLIFALFFNTDQERKLLQEKRAIEREYHRIEEKTDLLDAVVRNLNDRDIRIYDDIFDASPPGALFVDSVEIEYREDVLLLDDFLNLSQAKIKNTESKLIEVKKTMSKIVDLIRDTTYNTYDVPSISPIEDMSVSQAGASVGDKIHPFYKTRTPHTGLDIISVVGTNVIATADGVVKSAVRSDVQSGNYIEIEHEGGYITRYMYLSDMFVRKNQKVKRGDIIALVGMTGLSFAPHLHYEVEFEGRIMNPVNYMFAQLNSYDYAAMMLITYNTGQSLD